MSPWLRAHTVLPDTQIQFLAPISDGPQSPKAQLQRLPTPLAYVGTYTHTYNQEKEENKTRSPGDMYAYYNSGITFPCWIS